MIRLNERLNITEDQKTEIVSMLFTFIKRIKEERDIEKVKSEEILNLWLKFVKKPEWMDLKIKEEIEFVAGVSEFIKTYKDKIDEQEVKVYDLKFKEDESIEASREFLKELSKTKGININTTRLSKEDILKKIDKIFNLNNECNTLGDFPEALKKEPVS